MKPSKNAVYCPECRRTKMLFESETKANTFMRFNSEEIEELNGKAPIRAYFCEACAGWHLTSLAKPFNFSPTARAIRSTQQITDDFKRRDKQRVIEQKLNAYNKIVPSVKEKKYRAAFIALYSAWRTMENFENFPGVDTAKCQEIRRDGPEMADIILTLMYNELCSLKADTQTNQEEIKKKETEYYKSISALKKIKAFMECRQKHLELYTKITTQETPN